MPHSRSTDTRRAELGTAKAATAPKGVLHIQPGTALKATAEFRSCADPDAAGASQAAISTGVGVVTTGST